MSRHRHTKKKFKKFPVQLSKQFLTHNSAHILRLSISCLSSSSMQSTTEQVSSIIRERPSIISCKQDIGLFHVLGNAGSFTCWNVQSMVGGSKAKHCLLQQPSVLTKHCLSFCEDHHIWMTTTVTSDFHLL